MIKKKLSIVNIPQACMSIMFRPVGSLAPEDC